MIFPNTITIFHPDYLSLVTLYPVAAGTLRWTHRMLIPADRATPDWTPHWEKTFRLIEEGVFQKEDIACAIGIQQRLRRAAPTRHLTAGRAEQGIGWFHGDVARALGARAGAPGSVGLDLRAHDHRLPALALLRDEGGELGRRAADGDRRVGCSAAPARPARCIALAPPRRRACRAAGWARLAGASRPYHCVISKPGQPCSATVGTSGSCGDALASCRWRCSGACRS